MGEVRARFRFASGSRSVEHIMDPDPDPWNISWIRIRQNDADPLDPNSHHCLNQSVFEVNSSYSIISERF